MRIKEFSEGMNMNVLAGNNALDKDVTGLYVCDLLSWVMSHVEKGNAWVTVLTNINTVAVAVLTEISCIILPENVCIEEMTKRKADQEGVVILGSNMSAFEICNRAQRLMSGLEL